MGNQQSTQPWQVEVGGQIYDASFNELGEWIGEGSLQPEDKVRKGNLRWIEARKIPGLTPFFNAKAKGEPMPVVITTTEAIESSQDLIKADIASETENPVAVTSHPVNVQPTALGKTFNAPADPDYCANHPEIPSFYVCESCCNGFCIACPSSYGGSVNICPACGTMCKPIVEARATAQKVVAASTAVAEGFGASDFFSALSHPFKFKVSLVVGAVMFMFLTLGKSAAAMGGIYMIVGGIFSGMSANALTFGVLSNTINNFIQGRLDANFMPDFENFDVWEDVVHPFFLSIAAYLSSFGPFLLVLAVGFYLVTNAVNSEFDSYKSDLEKIPGTHVYAGRELVDQTGDVKDVLNRIDEKQQDRIANATQLADDQDNMTVANTDPTPFVDEESQQQEELWRMANESRSNQLESVLGKTSETRAEEEAAMINAFLRLAPPLVVLGFITFLWGLIYFPAASAVAGYTRSFVATINPLVGLDTIRRLGMVYVKILAMGFCLLAVSLLAGALLGLIFKPFDLPGIGNLLANAIGGLLTFYLMAVFSCILGYALYKSADKLGLSR